MTTFSSHGLENETSPLPVARIDALDETYSLPLREYFVTHGCQVFVNEGPTENVMYHFIVGDWNFVKKILVFRHTLGKKNCVLTWDQYKDDGTLSYLPNTKIISLDPTPLTPENIHTIFSFFFTSPKKFLDQKEQSSKKQTTNVLHTMSPSDTTGNDKEEERASVADDKRRIRDVMNSVFEEKKPKASSPKMKQSRSSSFILSTILLTLFIFLSPFLLYTLSLFGQIWSLRAGVSCLTTGNISCTKNSIQATRAWRAQTNLSKTIVLPLLRLVQGNAAEQSHERFFFFLETITTVLDNAKDVSTSATTLLSGIIENTNEEKKDTPLLAMEAMKKTIPVTRTYIDLSSATLTLFSQETAFPFSQPSIKALIGKTEKTLSGIRAIAETGEKILQLYPTLAGFKHPEKILVILQNNSELRPTGGFIGSLGLIDIEEGIVKNLKIEDVYNVDGQLKGHVDPPAMIKELLNQEHWYLRDSNWHPDFKESATMARWFYEKETGEQVNIVVGINTSLITKLLKVTGPIKLPSYNDNITADNFYAKAFYYTQVDFFPGSTQKKDFLGMLTTALLEKLKSQGSSMGASLLNIISDSLASSDIQLFVDDEEMQTAITRFGWGGVVPQASSCVITDQQTPCSFSYLYVNEANTSVNKVNTFIVRSQERAITIDEEGTIKHQITRKIKNLSQGEPGAGSYTTYIRFLLPSTVSIQAATIDGKPVPTRDEKQKKQDIPFGLIENGIPGITTLGIALVIPPGQEKSITVSYTSSARLSFGSNGSIFSLFEQKQPGVDTVSTRTTITYPSWWQIDVSGTKITDILANPGNFRYNTILTEGSEERIFFQNHP